MNRLPKLIASLLALGLVLVWCSPGRAEKTERPTRGTIQSINAGQHQIMVTDRNNKSWTYHVMENAPVFMPNQANARLGDLKQGEDVSLLWEKKGDQFLATAILLHQGDFRNAELAAGTIRNVTAGSNQFTATDAQGKEWTYHVADNARLRLEGKEGHLNNFKANQHVVFAWQKVGDQYRILAMCNDPAHSR